MAPKLEKLHRYRHPLAVLLLAALTGLMYLPWTFDHCVHLVTCVNSGIYLTMAEQMAHGATPYRDVWDHKPPLVFYLNEIGLRLGRAMGAPLPCGVLFVCFFFSLCFFALMYAVAAPALGAVPTLIGILFAYHLFSALACAPNETQAFALPLQALSLLLLWAQWGALRPTEGQGGGRWALYGFCQGAIGALLLLLQPNLIGMTVVYVIVIVLSGRHKSKRLAATLGLVTLGFAVTCGLVLLPLFLRGAVRDFFYAAFQFNIEYSGLTTLRQKLVSIYIGFSKTSQFGMSLLAAPVAAAVAIRRPLHSAAGRLALLASLSLGVEAALSAVSGKGLDYYYLTWLPPMTILVGYFCHISLGGREQSDADPGRCGRVGDLVLALLLAVLICSSAARSISLRRRTVMQERFGNVVRAVRDESRPSDRVLVWGDWSQEIPFRLGRRPASRFFYSGSLGHGRSLYRGLAPRILSDLERNAPAFVVEVASLVPPGLPPLFAGELERQRGWQIGPEEWDTPELKAWKARLAERYRVVFIDPDATAVVYRRKAP